MRERQITELCQAVVAEILNRPANSISTSDTFSRLGLDSANSVNLLLSLESALDLELEEDLLTEHQTIEAVALELSARSSPGQRS